MHTETHNKDWKKWAVLFLASQNLSLFGSSVTGLAIIWHVTLLTSSGSWMTLFVLASMLPQLVISLWGGVWADRYNRKFLIMGADGGIASVTLILALLYLYGYTHIELLLGVAVVRSLGSGIQSPAVSAVIPQLVPANHLTRFNGVNQSLQSIMQLLAPAAGGFVLASAGIVWAFMLDVVTATLAIIILYKTPVQKIEQTGKERTSAWHELKQGVVFCWSQPFLKRLILCYGVASILITPAAFLTPIMVERSFGNDIWLLTANEAFWTGGTLLGGLYIALKGNLNNKVRIIAFSLTGFGVCFTLLGAVQNFTFYLFWLSVSGAILPFWVTAENVLIQENVEKHMMGRVFSILQILALASMPVAMLGFGPLADVVKIETILVVTGVLLILVGLAFFRSTKGITGWDT